MFSGLKYIAAGLGLMLLIGLIGATSPWVVLPVVGLGLGIMLLSVVLPLMRLRR